MKIEGYFSKIKTANDTVEKLKGLGVKNTFVDINDHHNENRSTQISLPGTETSVSLSDLVLNSGAPGISEDKAPLDASSPMVSGYGSFEEIADVNCKVIAEVEERDIDKVKQTIQSLGGDLESPNVKKPKIENEDEYSINNILSENQKFLEREGK
jgi:hypothetical protein